jgi:hypothetical protein
MQVREAGKKYYPKTGGARRKDNSGRLLMTG